MFGALHGRSLSSIARFVLHSRVDARIRPDALAGMHRPKRTDMPPPKDRIQAMSLQPESLASPSSTQVRLAWAMALACGVTIFTLGGDAFSAAQTSRILGPLIMWLYPDLNEAEFAWALYSTRKAAHVCEYGLFALLSFRAIGLTWARTQLSIQSRTLALCAVLASFDEFRQGLSAARTGSGADALLDLTGAGAALACLAVLDRALGRPFFRRRQGRGGVTTLFESGPLRFNERPLVSRPVRVWRRRHVAWRHLVAYGIRIASP